MKSSLPSALEPVASAVVGGFTGVEVESGYGGGHCFSSFQAVTWTPRPVGRGG